MRKMLSVLCAVALLFCASAGLAEETISYWAYWCGDVTDEDYVVKYVEDALGIDVDVKRVPHQDKDALNLMLATGEMPDCGWFDVGYQFMLDNELIREIPVSIVKEYCPGYIELCDQYPMLYPQSLNPDDNTQFRYICDGNESEANRYVYNYYLRYDWVQKLGIDLGDVQIKQLDDQLFIADKGLSRDVFTEVMRRFVNDDPDGNGEKDTYGIITDWDKLPMMSSVGLINSNMEYEGHVIEWFTHPALKPHLEYLREIYQEGLIYPEFFTIGWGEDWEIINNYKCGVMAKSSTCCLNSWASNRPPRTLLDNGDPEVKLLMFPGVADETGHTYRSRQLSVNAYNNFYVNADVTDEKLVEIMKFLQFCCFNDDQNINATLWYGEEGVNWVWENDRPTMTDTPVINGERGSQIFIRDMQIGESVEWVAYEPQFMLGMDYYCESDDGIWCPDLQFQYKADVFGATKAAEISAEYAADWTSVRDAYFMDVLLGKKNTESDWDAYIEAMNAAHYGEYIAELDKAPAVSELFERYR